MNPITILGLATVFLYSLIQILNFYGVDHTDYGVYILFYVFIILSMIILPNDYPKV
jgi:hypothetical protein